MSKITVEKAGAIYSTTVNNSPCIVDHTGDISKIYEAPSYTDTCSLYSLVLDDKALFDSLFLTLKEMSKSDLQHEYNCIFAAYENCDVWDEEAYKEKLSIVSMIHLIRFGTELGNDNAT